MYEPHDLRYGSLFSGNNGIDIGVQSVLGGTTSWFSENDKACSKILAYHYPDVSNLGDITKIDWSGGDANGSFADVDVITGGSP